MPQHETDPRILGQRIAEARKSRGKTQEEVAEFLGYSRPTYIAIEKGERTSPARSSIWRHSSGARSTIWSDLASRSLISSRTFGPSPTR